MSKISLFIILLSLSFVQNVQAYPINVTDDFGYNVTINSSNKIVSLAPSNTEILFAVGAGIRVVGVTDYCDYPPEVRNISKIGGFANVNIEAVVNLTPDLVLAAYGNGEQTINQLRNLNLTVVALNPKNTEDIIKNILLVGNITENDANASMIAENMRQEIKNITDVTNNLLENQKAKVLYIVWDAPLYAAGNDTYADDLIKKAGGINIAKSSGWPVMSLESVIAENPQIIITSSMGAGASEAMRDRIMNNTVLAQTDAVRDGRVYAVSDPNIIERAGPRITQGLKELYEYIAPKILSESNPSILLSTNKTAIVFSSIKDITMDLQASRNLTATIHASSSASPADFGVPSLGKYITINTSDNLQSNLSSAFIRVYYTQSEIDNANMQESSLKLRWYNESSQAWENLGTQPWFFGAGVDTKDIGSYSGYVWVNVSHLSTFGITGTVKPATTQSSNGGGSGGSGIVTAEPYENIVKAETKEKSLLANQPVTYAFTSPELGVYEISITGKENENDIAVKVEALKNTSKLVTASAPGIVYKNLNILAGTRKIKEAIIRFKVDNSWLDSGSLAGSSIKIVKWDGSKWVQLETTEKTKDSAFTYYEAKVETFSSFAITVSKAAASPTAMQADVSATPTVIIPAETTAFPTPASTPKSPGFEYTLAVAVLVAVFLKRRL